MGPGSIPWYTTREEVRASFEFPDGLRASTSLDRHIDAASRSIDNTMSRVFYPTIGTKYFDWPSPYVLANGYYFLWLAPWDVISLTRVEIGGVELTAGNYFLRPEGVPPYTRLEVALGSQSGFLSAGSNAWQRSVSATGMFGYGNDTIAAGTIAEALDDSETGVDISDSSSVGVGDAILVGTEYMIVQSKSMLTSGQTLQTPLTASNANAVVAVTTGSAFFAGETILLDSERMQILDVAGNNLIVKRATDGTTLAAHTGSTLYAPRTLTVTRGALGSTAATHLSGAALLRHQAPSPIRQLAGAMAQDGYLQEQSGWSRTVGSGDNLRNATGAALKDLKQSVWEDYARRTRNAAV
jgi:hypothetical protein